MKKYFMKDTEDELQFGDMVEVDLTEDMPDGGVKHKHLECKFIPELVDMLVEHDIIDVVSDEADTKEEDEPTEEECCIIEQMVIAHENLEAKVEELENEVVSLKNAVAKLVAKLHHGKQAV